MTLYIYAYIWVDVQKARCHLVVGILYIDGLSIETCYFVYFFANEVQSGVAKGP